MHNGFLVNFDTLDERESDAWHYFGGRLQTQPKCPTCNRELILIASIDTSDVRLGFHSCGVRYIRVLYDVRCPLLERDFSYQLTGSDSIRIVESNSNGLWDGSDLNEIGVPLPQKPFRLFPTSENLQQLSSRLRFKSSKLSELEAEIYRGYSGTNVDGGNPLSGHFPFINQVLGTPLTMQRFTLPLCPVCCPNIVEREEFDTKAIVALQKDQLLTREGQMEFLGVFADDEENGVYFGFGSCAQIIA